MADLIGMGSLDHKGFGALYPQFWRARTATGPVTCRIPDRRNTQVRLMHLLGNGTSAATSLQGRPSTVHNYTSEQEKS